MSEEIIGKLDTIGNFEREAKASMKTTLDIWDPAQFDHLARMSQAFAATSLVPDEFRGKPENCMIALQIAARMGADPFAVIQNIHVIHGKPCFSAAFAIALANTSGKLEGPITFETRGVDKSMTCVAIARLKGGVELKEEFSMAMADAEGYTSRKGNKYKTLPKLMLRYRAAMFLIRLHCPEILMGMTHSSEELQDIRQAEGREVSFKKEPVPQVSLPPETLELSEQEMQEVFLKEQAETRSQMQANIARTTDEAMVDAARKVAMRKAPSKTPEITREPEVLELSEEKMRKAVMRQDK